MLRTEYKHIMLDDDGNAFIEGHPRMKVCILAGHALTNGWTPEELKWQFPHLSMAEIHAAMSYYYDHQAEIEAQMQADRDVPDLGDLSKRLTRLDLLQRRSDASA